MLIPLIADIMGEIAKNVHEPLEFHEGSFSLFIANNELFLSR